MTQVASHHADIKSFNINVVAVSFGQPFFAKGWLQTTNSPFPIWLDPERISYSAYSLERSWLRTYAPSNLWFYAKRKLRGEEAQSSHGDDTKQMGGNFIVDTSGKIRFAHYCKDPTDRPSMAQLLKQFETLS